MIGKRRASKYKHPMNAPTDNPKRILLFGATGTIGRATARELVAAGHHVTCFVRNIPDDQPEGCRFVQGTLDDLARLAGAMAGVEAVVSCLSSRTGEPDDAWAVDYQAHADILLAARQASVPQFILLSAICVQKPDLAFQQAKLAFEKDLMNSGLTYSIVRPTAFFKSLSGQLKRVQAGKGFLLFGDGERTACKPISDRDLGRYLNACVSNPALHDKVLPIGGPGPAITPRQQGELLFKVLGQEPKFKSVPFGLMDGIVSVLSLGGVIVPALKRKAELAKIGRYYATESMLVWTGSRYDAEATPSFGTDTLEDHYRALVAGDVAADLGDHAVF